MSFEIRHRHFSEKSNIKYSVKMSSGSTVVQDWILRLIRYGQNIGYAQIGKSKSYAVRQLARVPKGKIAYKTTPRNFAVGIPARDAQIWEMQKHNAWFCDMVREWLDTQIKRRYIKQTQYFGCLPEKHYPRVHSKRAS